MAISVATHLRSLFLEFQVAGVHRLPYRCCLANERTGKVFNEIKMKQRSTYRSQVIQFKQGGVQELLRTLDLYIERI